MPHIHHPSFDSPDAALNLFATKVRRISGRWFIPFLMGEAKEVTDSGIPPWTKDEERTMFLQWNWLRFTNDPRARQWESDIAEANLGLVCCIVAKHHNFDGDYDDANSEGQAALVRAMDRFDVLRNYKFSTYACASIHRALIRRYRKAVKQSTRFGSRYDPKLDRPLPVDAPWAEEEAHLNRARGLADLSVQELIVIEMRFFNDPPLTLNQTGAFLAKRDGTTGVTKEWVRQLERTALNKLRESYMLGME